jgi:hypothetical protein
MVVDPAGDPVGACPRAKFGKSLSPTKTFPSQRLIYNNSGCHWKAGWGIYASQTSCEKLTDLGGEGMGGRFLSGLKLSIAGVLLIAMVSACGAQPVKTEAPAEVPQASPQNDAASFFSSMSENVDKYSILIGLRQAGIEAMFDESSTAIHDQGIEFKNAGVKIWFDEDHGRAVHVMIVSKEVDFNGARIGASEQSFEDIFGKPIDSHPGKGYKDYDYENLILRLYYDAAGGKTEAVSLMLEQPEGGEQQ